MVSIRVSVMANLVWQLAWFWKKGKPPRHTIEGFSCSVYWKWKDLLTPIWVPLSGGSSGKRRSKKEASLLPVALTFTGKFICPVAAAAAAILHSYQNPVSLVSQHGPKTIDSVRIYRPPTQDWGCWGPHPLEWSSIFNMRWITLGYSNPIMWSHSRKSHFIGSASLKNLD